MKSLLFGIACPRNACADSRFGFWLRGPVEKFHVSPGEGPSAQKCRRWSRIIPSQGRTRPKISCFSGWSASRNAGANPGPKSLCLNLVGERQTPIVSPEDTSASRLIRIWKIRIPRKMKSCRNYISISTMLFCTLNSIFALFESWFCLQADYIVKTGEEFVWTSNQAGIRFSIFGLSGTHLCIVGPEAPWIHNCVQTLHGMCVRAALLTSHKHAKHN